MQITHVLREFTKQLEAAGISSARLDTLILIEDATGKDRAWLLAHPEHIVSDELFAELQTQIIRRTTHEPLAYIRGKSEFYGREFSVNQHVLEPRPESEAIIDMLLSVAPELPTQPVIIDVGTGSGALAITAELELSAICGSSVTVISTDIDPNCLEAAAQNARTLGTETRFVRADLIHPHEQQQRSSKYLHALPPAIDVILANLPYVPDDFAINLAAGHEPRIAIFGGPDGLDLYRRLFAQIRARHALPRYVITEALPPHHADLAAIAKEAGYSLKAATGFVQLFQAGTPATP